MIALGRKAAAALEDDGVAVHLVDPGLTATAPGMAEMGARPVSEGAESVLHPILHPGELAPGSFSRDGREMPW